MTKLEMLQILNDFLQRKENSLECVTQKEKRENKRECDALRIAIAALKESGGF